VFNINLNYDINQALDPEEWDSDFCAISLHGAIEYLVSDVKNIKNSLWRMGKYIRDKSIDSNPNNIKNLEGVGKAVYKFLSSIYNSHWDGLYIDNTNTTFRNKVSFKFTPQVLKNSNVNNKDKDMLKPTFISFIPPLFQLSHRKKSTSFWNISRRTPTCNRRSLTPIPLLQPNHSAYLPQRTVMINASRIQHGEGQRIWRHDQLYHSSLSQHLM